VERAELTRAQSRLQATQALAYIVGPALAGLVVAWAGVGWAVLVDGLTFAVSAGTLAVIRLRETPATTEQVGVIENVGAGLRFLFGHPLLAAMTTLLLPVALLNSGGLSGAGAIDLMVFHLRHDLGRGESAVGITLAIAASGAVLGAVAAPTLRRRLGFASCFLGGTGLQGLGLCTMGLLGTARATAIGAALWAAGLTLRVVPSVAIRQALIPDALLGRVTAASWLIVFAAGAVGSAIISRVAAVVGVTATMTWMGALVALVAIAGLFSRLRTANPEALR
jgi:Transmembrane secretion effector